MTDVAALGVKVTPSGIEATNKQLGTLSTMAGKAERSATLLGGALGKIASIAGLAFSAMAVRDAVDSWSDLNSRVALAVGGIEKGAVVMDRLRSVAKSTYSDMASTAESFMANAGVLRELGRSTNQALDYTEALNNAMVVSGAKGDRAMRVQNAMSKAMALGALRGDNLNTVIEAGGRVTELLAEELGVSTLELRKLGSEGKITGDVMYNSLTKNLQKLRDEAGDMPATLGDAGTALSNMFLIVTGSIDGALEASGSLAQAIYDMAYTVIDNTDSIVAAFVFMKDVIGQVLGAVTEFLAPLTEGWDLTSAKIIAGSALAAAAIGTLAVALGTTLVGAISAVTVAILANPIGLIVAALAGAVAAAYIFRDEIGQIFGIDLMQTVADASNAIIGAMVGAYRVATEQWRDLPTLYEFLFKSAVNNAIDAFIRLVESVETLSESIPDALRYAMDEFPAIIGNAMIAGAKLAIGAISWLVNQAVDMLNSLLSGVRWLLDQAGIGMQEIGKVDFGKGLDLIPVATKKAGKAIKDFARGMKFDISDATQSVGDTTKKIFSDSMAVDYIGNMNSSLSETWKNAKDVGGEFEEINKSLSMDGGTSKLADLENGTKKAGGAAKGASNAYQELTQSVKDSIEQLQLEKTLVGQYGANAEVARMKLDLFQQAQSKGITLTAAMKAELEGLADQYGEVAKELAALELMEKARIDRGSIGMSAVGNKIASDLRDAGIEFDSAIGKAYASYVKMTDAMSTAKGMAKEFMSGFIGDLLNGESAMKALTNAVSKLADKLIDMALDSAINSLFSGIMGIFGGGGGGGILGSLIGGGGGFPAAPVGLFAKGGVSNQPAIFGEAGPEAAVPLPDGRSIPVTLSQPRQTQQNNGPMHVTIGWSNTADGNLKPFVESVSRDTAAPMVAQGLNQFSKQVLPSRVNEISRDPRARNN